MPEDFQKQLLGDHDTLTRLETKFDAFAIEMRAAYTDIVKNVGDHEARVRVVETEIDRAKSMGKVVIDLEARMGTVEKSVDEAKTTVKTVGLIATLVGAFIGATASIIVIISGILNRH
jgi:hypothetical protein